MLKLDRILYTSTHYPANYGFIPLTYAEDEAPLDVLILCSEAIEPMILVRAYPIGVISMIDNEQKDEKIIAIPFDDLTYNSYRSVEERILASEFLSRLGNKKSRFIVQLICDYIAAHPEVINPQETLKFIVNSTSLGETLAETVRSMVQSELAGKMVLQQSGEPDAEKNAPNIDADIDGMLENLDM